MIPFLFNKPAVKLKLDFEMIKKHCEAGYNIIRNITDSDRVCNGVLLHHERWDGKGYPQGLKGENIPLFARVINVVDAYDAMTNDRVYHKAISQQKAIEEIKAAMEGMLSPDIEEKVLGTAEIRETYKISKVGTIAGSMVLSGKIYKDAEIRLIRDGVVIYTGVLSSLKRFKDDAKEVAKGYDCGMQIKNYNDIKENDVIECFREVAVKKKLK